MAVEPPSGGEAQSTDDLQLQEYLFDLNGYLVVEDVLGPEDVAALKRSVDQRLAAEGEVLGDHMVRFGAAPAGPGFCHGGTRSAPCSPTRASCRSCASGSATAFVWTASTGSACARGCHAAYCMPITAPALPWAEPRPGPTFRSGRNQIAEGFVVVTFNLTDAGPDHGGFCCIPWQPQEPLPAAAADSESPERCPFVVVPEVPGGLRDPVHGGADARHGGMAGLPRTPLAAVQVLRVARRLDRQPGGAASCHGAHRAAEDPVSRAGRPAPPLPVLVPGDRASLERGYR